MAKAVQKKTDVVAAQSTAEVPKAQGTENSVIKKIILTLIGILISTHLWLLSYFLLRAYIHLEKIR